MRRFKGISLSLQDAWFKLASAAISTAMATSGEAESTLQTYEAYKEIIGGKVEEFLALDHVCSWVRLVCV